MLLIKFRHHLCAVALFTAAGCRSHPLAEVRAADVSQIISSPSNFDCSKLSSGLYWYGKGNRAQLATGAPSDFYNETKPTLIYFHGWQQGTVKNGRRETFVIPSTTSYPDQNVADAWIDAGWNMGIFDWTQFADKTLVSTAEEGLWSAGSAGTMSWTTCKGESTDGVAAGVNVTDLATAAITTAMAGYKGGNLRLVGHSLGAQLATRVAGALATAAGGVLRPKRVALLDPYWSATNQPHTADEDTDIVRSSRSSGTVWEMYKTSPILDLWLGAQNTDLTKLIGHLRYQPNYWGFNPFVNLVNQHLVARNIYFSSFKQASVQGCLSSASGIPCLAASASDQNVGAFDRQAASFTQSAGMKTETLADDAFDTVQMVGAEANQGTASGQQYTAEQVLAAAATVAGGGAIPASPLPSGKAPVASE